MRNLRLFLAVCFCTLALNGLGFSQATGIYAFGPYDSPGFDTINRGNLNLHFSIPIFSKPGRGGSNFVYALTYDGLIWSPTSSSGTNVWTPASAWGWGDVTNAEWGYVTYNYSLVKCTLPPKGLQELYASYSGYVYHDNKGVPHSITFSYADSCGNTGAPTGTGTYTLTDNSGLVIYRNGNSFTVFNKEGAEFAVPTYIGFNGHYSEQSQPAAGVFTDTNGNQISASSSGIFTDTMGKTVLSISGTAPSPVVYTYTDSNGNSQTVTVNYTSYTVQTAFGVSGITEFNQANTPLVSSIVFSGDGTSYSFTYEPTPGNSSAVTGRVASITLRTGGTITYTYTGGNNGIESDGTTAGLSRVTSDGAATYVRSGISSTASTTTFTDPTGNQTVSSFLINPTGGYFYEGDRKTYQGSASGTPLLEVQTCYNNSSCSNSSVTSAFTSIEIYKYQNGTLVDLDGQTYEGPELLATESSSSSNSNALYTYNQYTGPNNIAFYRIAQLTAGALPSGTTYQKTTYGYDETAPTGTSGLPQHIAVSTTRGNLTSVHQWYNSSGSTLNTTMAYDDAGQVLSQTDTNNDVTKYTYDPSTDTLLNQVTLPVVNGNSFSGSLNFDSNTGLLTSATDINSQTTTYSYDGMLRPLLIQYPDGGKTVYYYPNPNQISLYRYQNSSTFADTETLFDGYGRTSRLAAANSQSTNPWYQQDTCYSANGLVNFISYSYQGTGWPTPKVCSGSGDAYSYDALGRTLQVTHADNTAITYSYNATAAQITDENGASRIINMLSPQMVAGVCEISSNPSLPGSGSPVSCGMAIAGTGFLTTYSYNLASNEVTVTQGAQTRTFQTDWAGRPILVQEPESGQTTYSYGYNSTGLVATRIRPQANQTNPSVTTTTTTQYDALGRTTNIGYSDGTPTKSFLYDNQFGWGTQTNVKGMLSGYITYTGATYPPASDFSYDAMGRVIATGSCSPAECGIGGKNLSYGYDWTGNLTSEASDINGTINYGRSRAGEVTSISTLNPQSEYPANLVSNIVDGPNGPTSYQLGNGLSVAIGYDSLGRLSGRWVCQGTSQTYCAGGTQIYGFLATFSGNRTIDSCDTVINICYNNVYDEFNRLISITFSSGGTGQGPYNFTYSYDRWGNRWAQNALNGGPSPSVSFNTSTNQINSAGYAYDAAGNLINDGVHSYTYDAEGNVTAVDGGNTAKYVYDALNRRVEAQVGGVTTDYAYDYAGRRIENMGEPGEDTDEGRIYWDNMLLAYRGKDANTYFEHPDWVGNTRMRTDYQGNVAATFKSLPFGDGNSSTINDAAAGQDNTHFAMLDLDNETDTDHAAFRQYGNMQGRWMSPDPYGGSYDFTNPQSMNRYSYALNNPLVYVDPQGLDEADGSDPGGCLYDDPCGGDPNGDPSDNGDPGGNDPNGPGGIAPYTIRINTWWNFPDAINVFIYSPQSSNDPNNATSWYKNPCIQSALAKGAASTAIDAVGLLPEGGAVAGAFSLWHGAAGVSNGINILSRVQFGAAIISTASAGSDASQDGALSLAGAQLATGFASIGAGLLKAAPVVGQVISGISVAEDLYGTYKAVAGCHP